MASCASTWQSVWVHLCTLQFAKPYKLEEDLVRLYSLLHTLHSSTAVTVEESYRSVHGGMMSCACT